MTADRIHDAFLQAIGDAPDDDTPRLIYADWLDEHGQPERAELIRVQCALARQPIDPQQETELRGREQDLLDRFGPEWLRPLTEQGGTPPVFRRGFPEPGPSARVRPSRVCISYYV